MKYVNPTNDLAFKKVLGSNENIHILAGFIRDFFFIDPDGLTVENPYSIKAYKEQLKDEKAFRMRLTISDIAAIMSFSDYRSELQVRKENHFDERSIYYPLDKFVGRYKVVKDEASGYARLRPIYALNILGFNHFEEDEDALRVFQLYDPVRNKQFPKKLLNLGYFELLKANVETENQRHWQNYFMQRPLSNNAPDYIYDALHIIDRANINEEELKMMAHVEYLQSIYDNQISYAKDEARKEGHKEGHKEGREERNIEIAIKMLRRGTLIDVIVEDTGLDEATVRKLRNELGNE